MEMSFLKNMRRTAKYWWVGLLVGILILILGVWCLSVPITTLISLNIIFIASFIASGISDIIYAFTIRKDVSEWGWILAGGVISLAVGLLLLSKPLESFVFLLLYVGFWASFQSIMTITASILMYKNGWKGWGWLLVLGIVGVVFSYFLILNPAFASGFILTLFAFSLILYGVTRIFYSFKLRNLNKIINSDLFDQ